ncbi:MAG: UDP-N-acetylmuramoyl-tripeptide--D-alanyl-D-alanine ligase [Clostridiales bacterium]|nr:UDP-N-acetylmuramoyl-tripeptide--D-alanyl-D-alanine ligase [Clostridiales bacterium]
MMKIEEIIKATGGEIIYSDCAEISGISTDSRKITPDCLFVPIQGERFDGHDYIKQSFEAGAAAALTHRTAGNGQAEAGGGKSAMYEPLPGKTLIRVADTSKALRDLAAFYRSKFNIPFVGITGSVGKTSTKDMVAGVLQQKYKVLKTAGNFNNEIGLPLTIFNLDAGHEAAVLEMGMSGFGEIGRLAEIVKPDIAIITNIGISHIEKLGSKQNILRAKLEILEGLKPGGLVIMNGDDSLLRGLKDLLNKRTVFYGMDEGVDYRAVNINSRGELGTSFDITVANREFTVQLQVPGIHNVHNALAAIATGYELGVPVESIIDGISKFTPGKMRMDIIPANGFRIINDSYNASPQSMEAAIKVLMDMTGGGRRIAVLGDMLELGDWTEEAHRGVGNFAAVQGVDMLVTVGMNAKYIAQGAVDAGMPEIRTANFFTVEDAVEFLEEELLKDDVFLIKGSRGMKMEIIAEKLKEYGG